MTSNLTLMAQGSNNSMHRPVSSAADPSCPPPPLQPHNSHARSIVTPAPITNTVSAPQGSLANGGSPMHPSQSIASSGDVGVYPRRPSADRYSNRVKRRGKEAKC